ncbi:MAG: pantoate--beta-alanine ligase [Pseudomonadota bacterium]
MRTFENMQEWVAFRKTLEGSVGFVPTMGALHAGHGSLLQRSVEENDVTVLSIYVNPTQFNDPKDLANYPDTLDADLELAQKIGVDYVIMPGYAELYADNYRYQITESEFSRELCGQNRPGHFTGVLTVVMKLLNLVHANRAYFGKKDYQQFQLVKDMALTFFLDVEIVGCATIREKDGLAMSSRNKLLDARSRRLAGQLNCLLRSHRSDAEVIEQLQALGLTVDYVITRERRRFAAVVVECAEKTVRLIDNVGLQKA